MEFDKYRRLCAYHWRGVPVGSSLGFDPVMAAVYEASVSLLDLPQGIVLDVGGGDGAARWHVQRRGLMALGVDSELPALRMADGRLGVARSAAGDAYALPFAARSVSAVLMIEVIEHLVDPLRALTEIRRVLMPGGAVVVTTPLARPDGMVRDPFHVREFTAAELSEALAAVFGRVEVYGLLAPGAVARYRSPGLAGKVRRHVLKARARYGKNPFVTWLPPENGEAQSLVGVAR